MLKHVQSSVNWCQTGNFQNVCELISAVSSKRDSQNTIIILRF